MSAPVVLAVVSRYLLTYYTTLAPTCPPFQVSCGSAMDGGVVLPIPSGSGAAGRKLRQTPAKALISSFRRGAPVRSPEPGPGRLEASCGATKPAL